MHHVCLALKKRNLRLRWLASSNRTLNAIHTIQLSNHMAEKTATILQNPTDGACVRARRPLPESEFKNLAKWSRKLTKTPAEFGPMKRLHLSLPTPLRCRDGVKASSTHSYPQRRMDVSSQIDSQSTSSSGGWVGPEPVWTFWRRDNLRPFCPQTRHHIACALPGPVGPHRLKYFVARLILVNGNQECSSMLSTNDLATGYIWKSWYEANILAMNTQHSSGALKVVYK